MNETTQILRKIEEGDSGAAAELLPLVYRELRRLASSRLSQERQNHSLNATALVHEAYLRLVDVDSTQTFNSRGHFFAAAAEAMRRILVESARQNATLKRGGDHRRIAADPDQLSEIDGHIEVLQVNEVLDQFASEYPEIAELVRLKYFAGMSLTESAETLGISIRTAHRHWAFARAWLRQSIDDTSDT